MLEIYLLGCAVALGSATAAILRGEIGILGLITKNPPKWALVLEVVVATACSWVTVGFCQVQNAYRAAGQAEWACGTKEKNDV